MGKGEGGGEREAKGVREERKKTKEGAGRKGEGEGGTLRSHIPACWDQGPSPFCARESLPLSPCHWNIKAGFPASANVASFEVWQRWGHISG